MKNGSQALEASPNSGVMSNPLSFIHSGNYNYDLVAGLDGRDGNSFYWLLRSDNTINSSNLVFFNTYLDPRYGSNRGRGFAVHCAQILHHSH